MGPKIAPSRFGGRPARLCRHLGIEHPIVQAPMAGGWTTPELVAAVSNAGGLGVLAAGRLTIDALASGLRRIHELTDRPFGVNFLLAPPEPEPSPSEWAAIHRVLDPLRTELGLARSPEAPPPGPPVLEEQLELVLGDGVPIVSFAMGSPAPWVDRIHQRDGIVMAAATTPDEAVELARAGVDVVVAQGAEAGGHRATFEVGDPADLPLIGTLVLVPAVCDAVAVPVVASGGIMDGRGVAAALALGACGVQMGTRFLMSRESGAFPGYGRSLQEGGVESTRVTWSLTGRPARALANRVLELLEGTGGGHLSWPHQARAALDLYMAGIQRDEPELAPMLAGQGVGLARDLPSAGELVVRLVREMEEALG